LEDGFCLRGACGTPSPFFKLFYLKMKCHLSLNSVKMKHPIFLQIQLKNETPVFQKPILLFFEKGRLDLIKIEKNDVSGFDF